MSCFLLYNFFLTALVHSSPNNEDLNFTTHTASIKMKCINTYAILPVAQGGCPWHYHLHLNAKQHCHSTSYFGFWCPKPCLLFLWILPSTHNMDTRVEFGRRFYKIKPQLTQLNWQGNGPIRHVETCPDFFFHCKSTHNKIHYQNFSC
jgi:hypothetical protein